MTATDAGDIRIVKTDASETVRQVLYETASEIAALGGSDPRLAPIVPMSRRRLEKMINFLSSIRPAQLVR